MTLMKKTKSKVKFENNLTSKKKIPKTSKQPNIEFNTVTTFSRMDEEKDESNFDFNDPYGTPAEDNRVECSN